MVNVTAIVVCGKTVDISGYKPLTKSQLVADIEKAKDKETCKKVLENYKKNLK